MRMNFKRTFSGLLAFILMLSSLVVVNTASVSAATVKDTWKATDSNLSDWLKFPDTVDKSKTYNFSLGKANLSNADYILEFTDHIFDGDTGKPNSDQAIYSNKDAKATFTITTTKEKCNVLIYCYRDGNDDTATMSAKSSNDGQYTFINNKIPGRKNNAAKPVDVELNGIDTYTFSASGNKVGIFRIDLVYDDGQGGDTDERYTWKFDDNALSTLTSSLDGFEKNKLEFGVGEKIDTGSSVKTLTERNLLVYKGTNYIIIPTKEALSKDLKDDDGAEVVTYDDGSKTFTVKPTANMFKAAVVVLNANIKVTGGANRILHLTCKDGMVFSILLNSSGEAQTMLVSTNEKGGYDLDKLGDIGAGTITLHEDEYTASMSGGTLAPNAFNVTDGSSTYNAAKFTATPVKFLTEQVENIDPSKGIVNATDLVGERLYGGTILGGGYLRVVGNGYQNVYSVSGEADTPDYGEDAMAVVLRAAKDGGEQTEGSAEIAKGGIGFTVGELGDGKVGKITFTVQCVKDQNSDGDTATLALANTTGNYLDGIEEVGTEVKSETVEASGDEVSTKTITFDNLTSGEYAVYNKGKVGENGNIRIYSAKFEVADAPKEPEFVETLNANDLDDNLIPIISGTTSTSGSYMLDKDSKFLLDNTSGNSFIAKTRTNEDSNYINVTINDDMVTKANGNQQLTATKAVRTGTSGSSEKDYIKFTPTDDGKVYVYAASSKNANEDRTLCLNSNDKNSGITKAAYENNEYSKYEFDVLANTDYHLYSIKSMDIFYIGSTVALKEQQPPKPKINVKFSAEGEKLNSEIYIFKANDATNNNNKLEAKTDNPSISLTAEPGDTFIIAGKYDSQKRTYGSLPDNVYKWEPANVKDSKASILFHNGKESNHNERYFIYTVPSTAKPTDGAYGIKFTVASDITTLNEDKNITGDLASTIAGLTKTIGLGTYGFGEDKATLYGNDARKIVAYSFQTASANDYTSAGAGGTKYNNMDPEGYTTKGTEYGILNSEKTDSQYIIFKTGNWTNYANPETNECTAIIESSVNGIKVEKLTADGASDSSAQAEQEFETTGQHNVTLKPNSIYRVTALNKSDHKSSDSTLSYVKSIRITDPNNIFDSPVFERLEENQAVVSQQGNEVKQEVKELLTSDGKSSIEDTDTVFRIISEISLQGDSKGTPEQIEYALSQIKAVGYDVYDKDTYNKLNDLMMTYETSKSYFNANNSSAINGHLDSKGLSDTDLKPKDVIIFGDVVNTAVDTINTTDPGEPTANIGTIGDTSKLFVQTYYKIATGGSAKALIPWVSYDYAGGSSDYTKIYTISNQEGGNDPARILDPAAE